jgi:putative SOS response-associated peptidase YedK
VHDRMPVILKPGDYDLWLDSDVTNEGVLKPLLRPYPAGEMSAYAVGLLVNDPRRDEARCVEPRGADPATPTP